MNCEPYIIIHCIAWFEESVEDRLLTILNVFVKNNWPAACVLLKSSKPYWKIEGKQAIIYGLYNFEMITVNDFIKKIDVLWHYTESMSYSVPYNYSYQDESAIWDKEDESKEIFFLPSVSWAHVYTAQRKHK